MRSKFALAAVLCLAAGAAQADWKKDYDRGVKAAESGNWAEAASAMRAALAEDSEPNARKRFQGVVYKVYVPHHYAGLAAYRQGDCKTALDYWNNGANASVVSGIAALNSVQSKGIADCNTKLAAASKPTPPVATPTPQPPVVKPSEPVASTTPAKPPVTTPVKPAEPPPTKPVAPPAPSATPAPAALVGNVQKFIEGGYAAVAASDPNTFGDARSKAHGFLLRAAARHTLAGLGDAPQLELAKADVRAARAANSALAPDEALFSPRFRAFWKETR